MFTSIIFVVISHINLSMAKTLKMWKESPFCRKENENHQSCTAFFLKRDTDPDIQYIKYNYINIHAF